LREFILSMIWNVKYEVRGYTLPFTLYAAGEVQDFVFKCGLGAFTHKGFGMLDLANNMPSQRTEPYKFKREGFVPYRSQSHEPRKNDERADEGNGSTETEEEND